MKRCQVIVNVYRFQSRVV